MKWNVSDQFMGMQTQKMQTHSMIDRWSFDDVICPSESFFVHFAWRFELNLFTSQACKCTTYCSGVIVPILKHYFVHFAGHETLFLWEIMHNTTMEEPQGQKKNQN